MFKEESHCDIIETDDNLNGLIKENFVIPTSNLYENYSPTLFKSR